MRKSYYGDGVYRYGDSCHHTEGQYGPIAWEKNTREYYLLEKLDGTVVLRNRFSCTWEASRFLMDHKFYRAYTEWRLTGEFNLLVRFNTKMTHGGWKEELIEIESIDADEKAEQWLISEGFSTKVNTESHCDNLGKRFAKWIEAHDWLKENGFVQTVDRDVYWWYERDDSLYKLQRHLPNE